MKNKLHVISLNILLKSRKNEVKMKMFCLKITLNQAFLTFSLIYVATPSKSCCTIETQAMISTSL